MATLFIDCREKALITELESIDCKHEVKQLLVGDVEIRDKEGNILMVIERKTVSDLLASLTDGRYSEQRARLVDNFGSNVAYMIEGYDLHGRSSQGSSHGSSQGSSQGTLDDARMDGALMSLTLKHHIPIIHTNDVKHSAIYISRALNILNQIKKSSYGEISCRVASIHANKRNNMTQCYMQQLCQMPGISYDIAKNIAERFDSFKSLISILGPMSPKEQFETLRNIPKIGKTLSERIVSYVLS